MFSQKNKTKIFPVEESVTESDSDDMDRLCQIIYGYLLELEPDSSFRNKFGVIDLNFDDFEIKLVKLADCSPLMKKTYGFNVCPKEKDSHRYMPSSLCCSSIGCYSYDGIVTNHCNHNVSFWVPMFSPSYANNRHVEWFAFISNDNVHYRDKFSDDYWAAQSDKNDY